jgi:hypothetical protein
MDRVDDEDLGDERLLYRRIIPAWIIHEDGKHRPQSVALNKDRHTHEVSVFVADMTDVNALMKDYPNQSLIAFQAAIPRSCGGIIAKTPENPDPSHRVLCYPTSGAMGRAAKMIVDKSQWVVFHAPAT